MPKFRKIPVVVEAVQYNPGNGPQPWWDMQDFIGPENMIPYFLDEKGTFAIRTLEGDMRVSPGDWVVKGIKGEFWPVKPDIFALTYEPITVPDYVEGPGSFNGKPPGDCF